MAKKSTALSEPKSELKIFEIDDYPQGSDAWFEIRLGIPTASHFGIIMADGKDGGPSISRRKYLHALAGERMTGIPHESFKNEYMARGNAMEPVLRDAYAERMKTPVRQIGFATNFSGLKRCGASPDGLVGFDGGLEIKSAMPTVLIPLLERPAQMPSQHRAQVFGNMMVLERDWWDLEIGYTGMPSLRVRVYRDAGYIGELMNEIEKFNYELDQLVAKLKVMKGKG